MASIPVVMRWMRRTCRSEERLPSDEEFEANKPAYKEILKAAQSLGGGDPLDDIGEWAVAWTKETGQLPTPQQFRAQTRRILADYDVDVPDDSMLAKR